MFYRLHCVYYFHARTRIQHSAVHTYLTRTNLPFSYCNINLRTDLYVAVMWILGGYRKPHHVLAVSLTRFIPIPSLVVTHDYVLPISSPYRVNTPCGVPTWLRGTCILSIFIRYSNYIGTGCAWCRLHCWIVLVLQGYKPYM